MFRKGGEDVKSNYCFWFEKPDASLFTEQEKLIGGTYLWDDN